MAVRPTTDPPRGLPVLAGETLQAVVDHLIVGIVVTDAAGAVLSFNAEALRVHGFASQAELLPALPRYPELFELRYPDGRQMPFADWPASRALRGEYVIDYDVDLIRRDTGTRRHVRYGVVPIHDAAGLLAQLVFHMVDRTDQELAARAQRVAESRFRGVFEHAATGIAITSWDGTFLECNAAFATLVGYPVNVLRRMRIPDVMHPADLEANMREVARLQRGERRSFEIENRYLRNDGTPVHVHKYVSVLPDASGRPAQLMALVTDVTLRHQAEARRQWEAARNSLLLRLLRDQRAAEDPAAIMSAAAEGLGRLLGVARVGFFTVDDDVITRTVGWTDGTLPEIHGPVNTAALGPTLLARSRAGENTAIDDVHAYDWTPEAIRGLDGVGSVVVAPVRRDTQWYAGVYVHDRRRRGWQPHEITLVSEVAYQAHEAVERLTAQASLRLALEASAAGVWSLDFDNRQLTLDDRSRQLFGFGAGESVGFEAMAHRLDPADRIHVIARLEDVHHRTGPDQWDMEFRVRRPDGTVVWVHGLGRAERDASGQAARLRGIHLDITARKSAEAALREVRDQRRDDVETMRLLLEGAAQGILSIEPSGTIVTANAALETMFGYTPGELIGRPVSLLVPQQFHQRQADHRARYWADAARQAGISSELLGRRLDGSTFPIEVNVNHVETATGGRTIAFVTDVTARVRASEQLRDSEQRLRLALDAASAGAWLWDAARDEIIADERTCARLGLPPGPFPVARFDLNVHPDDRVAVRRAIDDVHRHGGEGWDVEFRRVGADGGISWHQSIARAQRDADGELIRVSGISLDITARKQAEADVARGHAALQAYATELEQRTGQLRRLASDLTLAEQHARERLARTLHDGLQQLLFGATLKIDRVIKGRGEGDLLRRARLDVQDAIDAARSLSIELFPPALRQEGLAAALEWLADWVHQKYGVVVQVAADPEANPLQEDVRLLLFESVRELLFNGVKHAAVSRLSLSLSRGSDDAVEICVADDGVGFDVEAALANAGTTRGGLGLFGIRERLTLLGGRFDAESAPARGTRFRLTVRRSAGSGTPVDPTGDRRRPRPETRAPSPRRLRVLIVDDHAVVRDGLRDLLAEHPQLAVAGEAADGGRAIAQADALRPDVIIMDVSMPGVDGVEATRAIRAAHPDIVIFGLSTQEQTDRRHAIEAAGAAAYFSKNDGASRLIGRLLELQRELPRADGST